MSAYDPSSMMLLKKGVDSPNTFNPEDSREALNKFSAQTASNEMFGRVSKTSRRFPALRNMPFNDNEFIDRAGDWSATGTASAASGGGGRPGSMAGPRLLDPKLKESVATFSPVSKLRAELVQGQFWRDREQMVNRPTGNLPKEAIDIEAPGRYSGDMWSDTKVRSSGAGTRSILDTRPPFSPCNASEAKSSITLQRRGVENHSHLDEEGNPWRFERYWSDSGAGNAYVGAASPYWATREAQTLEKMVNLQKRQLVSSRKTHVTPVCPTQAKGKIAVNYFLNSPDAEAIEAEKRYIKDKAGKNYKLLLKKIRDEMVTKTGRVRKSQ